MADSSIKNLPTEATSVNNSDYYAIDQGIETKKVKAQNILPDGSVTKEKLADAAVTFQKIADDNITEDKINAGAVTTDKIGDDAITNAKIADDAIQKENIKDGEATKSLYALLSTKTQSSTSGDDLLDGQAIPARYLSNNGDRIRVFVEFEQNLATAGTGKIKIIDDYDNSVKKTLSTETLDDQSQGIIEIELIRISNTQIRYIAKIYYFSQETLEDHANNGLAIEKGIITINSLSDNDLNIYVYGASTVANNVYCNLFWVDIIKRVNSRYIPS